MILGDKYFRFSITEHHRIRCLSLGFPPIAGQIRNSRGKLLYFVTVAERGQTLSASVEANRHLLSYLHIAMYDAK
jgi:hypothetical protein